jgi:hypothetical protein
VGQEVPDLLLTEAFRGALVMFGEQRHPADVVPDRVRGEVAHPHVLDQTDALRREWLHGPGPSKRDVVEEPQSGDNLLEHRYRDFSFDEDLHLKGTDVLWSQAVQRTARGEVLRELTNVFQVPRDRLGRQISSPHVLDQGFAHGHGVLR